MARTKATQFRLSPATLAQLDAVAARYGLTGRAGAIRWLASREMAQPAAWYTVFEAAARLDRVATQNTKQGDTTMVLMGRRYRVEVERQGASGWSILSSRADLGPVAEEIEAEITDGTGPRCERYRAGNGLTYRWAPSN